MFTPKGRFGWYELMTSDAAAAGAFYSKVVGWTTQTLTGGEGGMQYTTFNLDGAGIAGMLQMPGHSAWVGYIAVDDVDAHAERIVEAGGRLLRPAADVPGMLRFAVMTDPQGAAIVVFTPNPAMPTPARPQSPAPGTFGWHELYTTDLEAGFRFYQEIFGWRKMTDMSMGPMGTYRIFDQGEPKEMGDGGMMLKTPQVPMPCWNFYINVDSVSGAATRVTEGGGRVLNGPMQVPGGGSMLQGVDPQGAMFCLFSTEP